MRLTQRGFKDIDKSNRVAFSGTAMRWAQKLVVSEACCHQNNEDKKENWRLSTVDVKKAFLKGIIYEELARISGEPLIIVNFELDPRGVAVVRKFKGFEDFDPYYL